MQYGELVERVFSNVKSEAAKFSKRTGLPVDDCVSVGTMALVEAALKFTPKYETAGNLWNYARGRVIGAMLDYARKRNDYDRARGQNRLAFVGGIKALSMGSVRASQKHADPWVKQALGCLEDRERRVVVLIHWHGMTFREAGLQVGVGEARAWQIHDSALKTLRGYLE